ncbi:hypothetical protein LCGC14_2563740 [marine sediment metagenome]|uniref:Uncharacterized protein n=1 Tax=marine sediment metagenome TaxID=412755 RepID=A0A0F9AJS6_9ZZZZ
MSETKHTPLPWQATQDVGGSWHIDSGYRGNGTDYIPVADLRNDGEGNSKLIVTSVNARPKVEELVKAGKSIVTEFLEMSSGIEDTPYNVQRLETAIREVEAALKGEA